MNRQGIELYHIGEELENLHSDMINCHSKWPIIRLFRFKNNSYALVQPIKRLKILKMAQKIVLQIVKNVTLSKEKLAEQIEMNSLASNIKKQIKEKQNLHKKLYSQKNQGNWSGRSNFASKKKTNLGKLKGAKKSKIGKIKSKPSVLKDLKKENPDFNKGNLAPDHLIADTSKSRQKPKIKKSSLKNVLKQKKSQKKISINQKSLGKKDSDLSNENKNYFEPQFLLKVSKPKENLFKQNLNIKSNMEDEDDENAFFSSTSWRLEQKFNKRNSNGSHLRVLSGTSDFSKGISMNSNISKIRVLSGVSEHSEIANLKNLLEKKESESVSVSEDNSRGQSSRYKNNSKMDLGFDDEFERSSKDILKIESKLQKKGFLEESDIESSHIRNPQESHAESRESEMSIDNFSASRNSSNKKKRSKIVYNSRLKLKSHEISQLEDVFVPLFVKHIDQKNFSNEDSQEWKEKSEESFGSEGSSVLSSNEEMQLLEETEKMIQQMSSSRLNMKNLMEFAPSSAKKAIGSILDSRVLSNQSALEKGHLEGDVSSASIKNDSVLESQASKPQKSSPSLPDHRDIKIKNHSKSNGSSEDSFPEDRYDHEAILFDQKEKNDRVQGSPNLSDTFTSSRTQSFHEIERNYNNLMQNVQKTCLSQNFSIRTSIQNTVKLNKNSLDKASENQIEDDSLGVHKNTASKDGDNDGIDFASQRNLYLNVNRKK